VPKGKSEAVEPNLNAPANKVNFGGTCYGCELHKLSKLDAIMAAPQFKPTISQHAIEYENVLPDGMVKPCKH
jgi:Fe-S cluster biogenesis protein NfuA